MSNGLKRIEWIDIAKGMSIILVVFGHTKISSIPFFGDWLGSFRMPFFFFISGVLFNPIKNKDLKIFLSKKWKGLGRPFIIFSILVLLGYCCIGTEEIEFRLNTFPKLGWGGYALWFIPVLFVTNTLYFLLCRIFDSTPIKYCSVLILAIVGFISYKLELPNYWNLNFSLTAVFFYGTGNLVASILNKIYNYSNVKVLSIAFIAAICSFCFIYNDKPEFFVNYLGKGAITHFVGISGAIMMCCFAMLLSKINNAKGDKVKYILKYFGKNSYVVLAFHQIIITLMIFWVPQMPSLAKHSIMWMVLIVLIELINRKFPYVLGRPKDQKNNKSFESKSIFKLHPSIILKELKEVGLWQTIYYNIRIFGLKNGMKLPLFIYRGGGVRY